MLNVIIKSKFKRDLKLCKRRGKNIDLLESIIDLLQANKPLPKRSRDHILTGNYVNHKECHIEPDWLLIYQVIDNDLILTRTGSHSDLFD